MKTRIISAIVMIAIALPAFLYGNWILEVLLAAIVAGGAYEIAKISQEKFLPVIIFTILICEVMVFGQQLFSLDQKTLFAIYGIYLVFMLCYSIMKEHAEIGYICIVIVVSVLIIIAVSSIFMIYRDYGASLMFYIMICSLVCDTGAYFTGFFFGKRKLIERVSPKKTVEGAIGGEIIAFLVSLLYAKFFHYFGLSFVLIVLCSLILPVISMFGDLFFSLVKRKFSVKDYSNLIPGHGGILDRVDSIVFCLLVFNIMVTLL